MGTTLSNGDNLDASVNLFLGTVNALVLIKNSPRITVTTLNILKVISYKFISTYYYYYSITIFHPLLLTKIEVYCRTDDLIEFSIALYTIYSLNLSVSDKTLQLEDYL